MTTYAVLVAEPSGGTRFDLVDAPSPIEAAANAPYVEHQPSLAVRLARTLTIEDVPMVMAEYDRIVRANMSDTWDTIKAVAECRDGMWGALGETWETANHLGYLLPDDAVTDALQDAFDAYQGSLGREVAMRGYLGARNADVNPHQQWPIEEGCCSFHYPSDDATAARSDTDAAFLRQGATNR